MKSKLSSRDVLDLVIREIEESENSIDLSSIIYSVERKISWLESAPKKGKISSFLDKHQTSFWFFILLSVVFLTMKIFVENFFYSHY